MPCGNEPAIMRPASMHKMGRRRFPPAKTLCRMALWIETGSRVSSGISRSRAPSVSCWPCSRVSLSMTSEYNKGRNVDIVTGLRRATQERLCVHRLRSERRKVGLLPRIETANDVGDTLESGALQQAAG